MTSPKKNRLQAISDITATTTRAGRLRLIGEGGIIAASLGDESSESEKTVLVEDKAM